MSENTTAHPRKTSVAVFIAVFIPVFLLVVVVTNVVTFILPESYASTARIRIETNSASEFEIMQSQAVLGPAIEKLNLDVEWGRKYNGNAPLKTGDTMQLVKRHMNLAPERNTDVVDITVYSEDRNEAARIANAVAESYQDFSIERRKAALATVNPLIIIDLPVLIIDRAQPALRPCRPNKPLNITIGALMGILLGSIIGGASAGFISLFGRKGKAGQSSANK